MNKTSYVRLCNLVAGIICVAGTAGCAPDPDEQVPGAYTIVTTTGMITDIARTVAGERAEVVGLMREGVDPHLYKPTRSDVVKLQDADVVFYNGLMLEGKMADVLVSVARTGKPVFAVTDGLGDEYVLSVAGGHHDPHVWMDVKGWMHAVRTVTTALTEHDPSGAPAFAANADAYLNELSLLDEYARQVIGSIPRAQRVLVTAHDAFSYLGRAYDIEVRGIQGISTESEAGVRDINDLVDFLVERNIAAVFVETSVADKNVRALVEGAASRGREVAVGGKLFSDAMGTPGTYEGTYIGMIDHNVTTIARALGGQAPAGGFRQWKQARSTSVGAASADSPADAGDARP